MSVAVSIDVSKADLAALRRGMDAFAKAVPRSNRAVVKAAALAVTGSMRAAVGPRNRKAPGRARDIIDNPEYKPGRGRRKGSGAKFLIVVRSQNKPDRYLPANKKSDPRRRVARMGFAESMFKHMQAGISGRVASAKHRRARGFQRVLRHLRGDDPNIRLHSELGYVLRRYPTIVSEAVAKGARTLERRAQRDIDKAIAKAVRP